MVLEQDYQRVPEGEKYEDEDIMHDVPISPARPSWKKQTLLISLAVGTLLVAVLTAIAARTKSHSTASSSPTTTPSNITSPPLSLDIQDCGTNADEARALDCVYDVMMQLWTPKACFDSSLTERFLAAGNWTWWADPAASTVMTDEEVALGNHQVVYVNADYHKTHCIFAWEKTVRALRTMQPLTEQLISYDHAVHCRHRALAAADAKGAMAPTGFARCAMYETWLQVLPKNKNPSDA